MLLDTDPARETFDHQCDECGLVRRGLSMRPAVGGATGGLVIEPARPGDDRAHLLVGPCPGCAAEGVTTWQEFNADLWPHDAGEGPHPSLPVGTRLEGGRDRDGRTIMNVVTEHVRGGAGNPFRLEQARHIRNLLKHPHVAPHIPLVETRHKRPKE